MAKDASELAAAFGYLTQDEVLAIQKLAMTLPDIATVVNIGAGSGTSSLAIREANTYATIITIDISEGGPLGGLENERNAFENAGVDRIFWPLQRLGKSHDQAKLWHPDHKIDMLFVDDGHKEPEIRGDILGWLPLVKIGGIVAFHDYGSPRWPDVKMVVDELMPQYGRQILFVDSVIAFEVTK